MSGNLCHEGGGRGRRLMAKTILNFHFYYLHPSLSLVDCAVVVPVQAVLANLEGSELQVSGFP